VLRDHEGGRSRVEGVERLTGGRPAAPSPADSGAGMATERGWGLPAPS
jgi:hypothetical protein